MQGVQLGGLDEQGALHPVVPVADGREQANGGQGGLGEGHDDLEQGAVFAGAVDPRGLDEALRDRLEEVLHDDDVHGGHHPGGDERPDGVLQVQGPDQQYVVGHQSSAEQHREEDEQGDHIPGSDLLPGQGVSQHGGGQQMKKGTGHGDEYRHAVGLEYGAGPGEGVPVGIQSEPLGEHTVALRHQYVLGGKADGQDDQQGDDAHEAQQDKNQVDDRPGNRVIFRFQHSFSLPLRTWRCPGRPA